MAVSVLGSANLDRTLRVAALPGPGMTVLTLGSAEERPGGKGLNQAVAAARAGSPTSMIGRLGQDAAGDRLLALLTESGVDVSGMGRDALLPTGRATILTDAHDNLIVVESGANAAVEPGHIGAIDPEARVFLAQLELPIETIAAYFATPAAQGGRKILNAAPAIPGAEVLFGQADMLIFNQSEFAYYMQLDREPETMADLLVVQRLLTRPNQAAVVTLGAKGAVAVWADRTLFVGAHAVEAVDTTGAGDTFCGYVAAAVDQGIGPEPAMRLANAAAGLAVMQHGATDSIPMREAVERVLG